MKKNKKQIILNILAKLSLVGVSLQFKEEDFPEVLIPNKGDRIEVHLEKYYPEIKSVELEGSKELKSVAKVTNYLDKIWEKKQKAMNIEITEDINVVHMITSQEAVIMLRNSYLIKVNLNGMKILDPTSLKVEKVGFLTTKLGISKYFDFECSGSQRYEQKILVNCIGKGKIGDGDYSNKIYAFILTIDILDLKFNYVPIAEIKAVPSRFKIKVEKFYMDQGVKVSIFLMDEGKGMIAYTQDLTEINKPAVEDAKLNKFIAETRDGKEIHWTGCTTAKGLFTDTSQPVIILGGYQLFYEEKGEQFWPVIYVIKEMGGKFELYRERIVNIDINKKEYKESYFEVFHNDKYKSVGSYSFNIATKENFYEIGIEAKGSYILFMKPIKKEISGSDSKAALPIVELQGDYWLIYYKEPNVFKVRKGLAVLHKKNLNGGHNNDIGYSTVTVFRDDSESKVKDYLVISDAVSGIHLYYLNPNRTLIIDLREKMLTEAEEGRLILKDLKGEKNEQKFKIVFTKEPEFNLERKDYEVQGTEIVQVKIGDNNNKFKFLELEGENIEEQKAGYPLFFNRVPTHFNSIEEKFKTREIDDFLPIDDNYYFLGVKHHVKVGNGYEHKLYLVYCHIKIHLVNENKCEIRGENSINALEYYIRRSFSVSDYIGVVVEGMQTQRTKILFFNRKLEKMDKMEFEVATNYQVKDFLINTYDIQNSIDIYAILKMPGQARTTISFQEVYLNPSSNTLKAQSPSYFYASEKAISTLYYEPKNPHIRLSLLFEQDNFSKNRHFLIIDYKRVAGDNFDFLNHVLYEPIKTDPKAVLCPSKDYLMYYERNQGVESIFGEPKMRAYNGTMFKYDLEKGSIVLGSKCFSHLSVFQLFISTYDGDKYLVNLRAEMGLDFRKRYHSITKLPKDTVFFHSYNEIGKEFITTTLKRKGEKLGDEKLILFTYYNGPNFKIDSSSLKITDKLEYKMKAKDYSGKTITYSVNLKKIEIPKSEIVAKKDFPPKDFKLTPNTTINIDDMADTKGPVVDITITPPEGKIEGKDYKFTGRKPQVYGFFKADEFEVKKMTVFNDWLVALVYNKKQSTMMVKGIYKPTELSEKYKEERFTLPEDESKAKDIAYNGVKIVKDLSLDGKTEKSFMITTYQDHIEKGYSADVYLMVKNGDKEKPIKLAKINLEKQTFAEQFMIYSIGEDKIRLVYHEGVNLVFIHIFKVGEGNNWKANSEEIVYELSQEVKFWSLRRVKLKSEKLKKEMTGVIIFFTNTGSSQLSSTWIEDVMKDKKIQAFQFKDFNIYLKSGKGLGKTDLLDCDLTKKVTNVITTGTLKMECYSSFSGANDYFLEYKLNILKGFEENDRNIFEDVEITSTIVSTKGFESLSVAKSQNFTAVKMKNMRNYDKIESISQCPYVISIYKSGEKFSYAVADCREIGANSEKDDPQFSILSEGDQDILYISSKKTKTPVKRRNLQQDDNKDKDESSVNVYVVSKAKLAILSVFKLAGFKLNAKTENGVISNTNIMKALLIFLNIPLEIRLKISSIIWFFIISIVILAVGLFGIKIISKQGIYQIINGEKGYDEDIDEVDLEKGGDVGISEEVEEKSNGMMESVVMPGNL